MKTRFSLNTATPSLLFRPANKTIIATTPRSAKPDKPVLTNNLILEQRRQKMEREIKKINKNDIRELKNESKRLEQAVREAQASCVPGGFGQG